MPSNCIFSFSLLKKQHEEFLIGFNEVEGRE